MALAEQKRMAFKEQVTFFTDESKTRPVFGFKARRSSTSTPATTSPTSTGQQIGFFRKDFGASLLRSTFHVEGPGTPAPGRSATRWSRCCGGSPTSRSCRCTSTSSTRQGNVLLSSSRKFSVGDRYDVAVPDQRVDFRVAAAIAVGLDALMAR